MDWGWRGWSVSVHPFPCSGKPYGIVCARRGFQHGRNGPRRFRAGGRPVCGLCFPSYLMKFIGLR
jgi:hypothetical protein